MDTPFAAPPGESVSAFAGFADAARGVLAQLAFQLGFGLWVVTRVDGPQQRILVAHDRRYGVREGMAYPWLDRYCALLLSGEGPQLAWDCRTVPAYAQLPIVPEAPIRAFLAVPLLTAAGVVGVMAAVDPLPQTADLAADLPMVVLLARLLATVQAAEAAAAS